MESRRKLSELLELLARPITIGSSKPPSSGAHFIASGDNDLLALNECLGIPILSPADVMELLAGLADQVGE